MGGYWDPKYEVVLEDFQSAADQFATHRNWLVHSMSVQELNIDSPAPIFARLQELRDSCEHITSAAHVW